MQQQGVLQVGKRFPFDPASGTAMASTPGKDQMAAGHTHGFRLFKKIPSAMSIDV